MPPPNSQVGSPLATRTPPRFTGYVVVGGTWRITNLLKNVESMNEDEEIFNYAFYGPGLEATCQMYQKVTTPATADLEPSLVIDQEVTDQYPDAQSWVVLKADPIEFGNGKPIKFDVTLRWHEALDTTQTS